MRGFLLSIFHDVVNVWTLLEINPFISNNNGGSSITIPVFPTERWGFFLPDQVSKYRRECAGMAAPSISVLPYDTYLVLSVRWIPEQCYS